MKIESFHFTNILYDFSHRIVSSARHVYFIISSLLISENRYITHHIILITLMDDRIRNILQMNYPILCIIQLEQTKFLDFDDRKFSSCYNHAHVLFIQKLLRLPSATPKIDIVAPGLHLHKIRYLIRSGAYF